MHGIKPHSDIWCHCHNPALPSPIQPVRGIPLARWRDMETEKSTHLTRWVAQYRRSSHPLLMEVYLQLITVPIVNSLSIEEVTAGTSLWLCGLVIQFYYYYLPLPSCSISGILCHRHQTESEMEFLFRYLSIVCGFSSTTTLTTTRRRRRCSNKHCLPIKGQWNGVWFYFSWTTIDQLVRCYLK